MPTMGDDAFHITIPKHNWDGGAADMRATLQTWEWRWQAQKRAAVVLDFSNVAFMEPWALVQFAAFALRLKHAGAAVALQLEVENPSNAYFAAMGLAELVASGVTSDRWDESTKTTGLHVLRTHDDVRHFAASLSRIEGQLNDDTRDALAYSMQELGRNVVQHAASQVGGVALAQHFPNRQSVQVAIADCGVGVGDSLRGNYPQLRSALEALKLAILPRVSGARPRGPYGTFENAGLGLFFCKEIAWQAGGSFWLVSGDALLGVRDAEDRGAARTYRRVNPWNGTLVALDFPDTGVDDFGALMAVCQDLTMQAERQSSALALDFLSGPSEDEDAAALDFVELEIEPILENVEAAAKLRDGEIRPAVEAGRTVVLDFAGARFVTQSFVHALLHDIFRMPHSLTRLAFRNCSKPTEQAIRLVAAYTKASYWQLP